MDIKHRYVSVYLRQAEEEPASYYRIAQYLNKINNVDIKINNAVGKKQFRKSMDIKSPQICYFYKMYLYGIMNIREMYFLLRDIILRPEIIIISRTVIPKRLLLLPYILLKKLVNRSRLFWDFDDVIDLGEICKRQWKLLCKYSEKIIVTNDYLRNRISEEYRHKVIILPTTDGDMQKFNHQELRIQRMRLYEKSINILWLATAANMPFLMRIIPAIDECARILKQNNKCLKLYVVCNKQANIQTKYLEIINIMWSKQKALEMLQRAHIGIMPLIDSEYVRGKGGFKLIQYMASGIPVVASDVGFSHYVVTEDIGILVNDSENIECWKDAIYYLSTNRQYWEDLSNQTYHQWKEKFSFEINLKFWEDILYMEESEKKQDV